MLAASTPQGRSRPSAASKSGRETKRMVQARPGIGKRTTRSNVASGPAGALRQAVRVSMSSLAAASPGPS